MNASPTRLALHPNRTTHERHQLSADVESQASAAVVAGGGTVRLGERLEDAADLLRGQADAGVPHGEFECYPVGLFLQGADAEFDLPRRGKLDGVAQQLEEDLLQPESISHQVVRCLWVVREHEAHPLGSGPAGDKAQEMFQEWLKLKGTLGQHHLSGLDLGEVEEVVEQLQQAVGRSGHLGQVIMLSGGQLGLKHQVAQTDDGVHWSSNLVADVRQELAFGLVGGLGRLSSAPQCLFGLLAHGDVS